MHPNTMKHTKTWVHGPMGWIRCFGCEKLQRKFMAMFCNKFHAVTKRSQMHQNTTKRTEALVYCPMGQIGCVFCEKIPTWHRATNFCINCTTSPHFAPSFMQLRSNPKCTRTLWNAPKHEFRVQWGGSGALVAKNYNVTSWHELLY